MGAVGERDRAMGAQWEKGTMQWEHWGARAVGAVGEGDRAVGLSSTRGGKSSGSSGRAAGSGFEEDVSYRDAIQEGCLHAHQRTVLNGASMYG